MQCRVNHNDRTVTFEDGRTMTFEEVYHKGFTVLSHNGEYGELALRGCFDLSPSPSEVERLKKEAEEKKARYLINETIGKFLGK